MRTKLLSVFIASLMISGILAPLLMQGTTYTENNLKPTDLFELSSSSTTWHDDCSSASGWYENTTNVENQIDKVQTGIALLTDGNGLYSDSIPSASYDSHGPQFFKKLTTPMVLKNDLSLQVMIEHVGTSGSMGSIGIVLLDQNNDTFYKAGGVDGWVSSECNAWAGYRQDGSNVKMEYDTRSGAWIGTIRIWYDSLADSIKTNVTGSEVTLASSGEFNPNREVHFVGLVFYNNESNIYESHIVSDILLTSSVPQSILSSWHHDCSNTTGFVRNTTWPLDSWLNGVNEWTITDGDLLSSGDYLYFTGIPSASSGWHGPAFVHTLADSFPLSQLENFTVKLDVDNSLVSYGSKIQILLMDSNLRPVVRAYVGDAWNSVSEGQYFAEYMQPDGTYYRHGTDPIVTFTEFIGSMSFRYDVGVGVSASVTGFGETVLFSPNATELQREISHILILTGRLAGYAYMPSNIDDISLKWLNAVAEPVQFSWYHDCSNTTAFDGVADDSWYGNPDVHVDGSIASTGGYIYADDYGSGSVSYGPMMYHSFSKPFSLSSLNILSAEFEMDASSATRMAAGAIVLFDQNNDTLVTINVADSWSGYSVVAAYASYDFANGTRFVTPYTNPTWTATMPYREMISVIQNSTGIYATIPRIGNFEIISAANTEADRNITSIAINFRASTSASICEINRIHEISVNHLSTTDVITIDSPPDIVFTVGTSGHNITWTPKSTIPDLYEIFLDGDSIEAASWDGSPITINVDDLLLGIYNYSIYVNNTAGGSVTDWVLVTVNENGTTGTTETTETTGTEPETGPSDYLVIIISFGSVGVIVIIIGAICRNRGPGSTSVPNPGPTYEW